MVSFDKDHSSKGVAGKFRGSRISYSSVIVRIDRKPKSERYSKPKTVSPRYFISDWSSLSKEDICMPLDQLLYSSSVEDRFHATTGTLHSLDTVILDVAPHIRQILRTEYERRHFKSEKLSLDSLWSNKRKTRGQAKEESEGRKRYFNDRVDEDVVLKTWLDITACTEIIDHTGNDLHKME